MSLAEEIKARLDIVNYIQQYVPIKKAGRIYKAPCPFHAEKTPSFVVNPDKQTWRCFGACAEGGDVFTFAQKLHGWNFKEALTELGRQVGVEVEQRTPKQKAQSDHLDQLRGLMDVAAQFYHERLLDPSDPGAVAALRYAREKRGFTDETIQRFQIGYAPPGWQTLIETLEALGYKQEVLLEAGLASSNETGRVYDRFRNRLMVPIRDARGRTVGFGARVLDPNDNPKYLNSPQTPIFDKSKLLFGLDMARSAIRETGTAVIVEGYMDAIQAHQAGFTNVVAQMGTAMTEMQIATLAPRLAQKIILALDADAAGQNATLRSLEVARHTLQADYAGRLSVDIRVMQIPGAKDPDDLLRETPELWQTLVENALPVADFVIETETRTLPPNPSMQEREALARRLLPILLASESNLYTRDNLQKLALKLRIAERDLLYWSRQVSDQINAAKKHPQHPPHDHRSSQAAGAPVYFDEPPPLDYEALAPPEDDVEVDFGADLIDTRLMAAANGALSRRVPAARDMNVEAYCLRMLFLEPGLLFQVNRKLRQLAGENTALSNGPLAEFGVDDFTNSDYAELMRVLIAALNQDELDFQDYCIEALDESLFQELERLLMAEPESVRARINGRFDEDFAIIWRQHERFGHTNAAEQELIEKVLHLRKRNLERLGTELRFVIDEARFSGQEITALIQQASLSLLALALINAEIKNMNSFSNRKAMLAVPK